MPFQMPQIENHIGNALANIGQIRQQRTQNALADRQLALTEGAQRRQQQEFDAAQLSAAQERQRTALADVFNAVEQGKTPERAMAIGASIMQSPEWQARFGQGGDTLAQQMLSQPDAWKPENIRTAAARFGIRLRSAELADMATEARVKRAPETPRYDYRDTAQGVIAANTLDPTDVRLTGYDPRPPAPSQPPQPNVLTIIPGMTDANGMPVAYDGRTNAVAPVGMGRPQPGAAPPTLRRTPKPVPAAVQTAIQQNASSIRSVQSALRLLNGEQVGGMKGDKGATGPMNAVIPDAALEYFDEGGVQTRAAVADVGSLVIHDRSGAAVTAAEFPRLRPFIPTVNDPPGAARLKLERMLAVLQDEAAAYQSAFGENGPVQPANPGGRPRTPPQQGPARISNDAQFDALPRGALFIGPDGQTRRKP